MEDQTKIAELEQRLEAMGRRIDDLAERAGQRIDPTGARRKDQMSSRSFWGLIFLIVGSVWLSNRMGWFYFDIPIAATVLIVIGIYMIVTSKR